MINGLPHSKGNLPLSWPSPSLCSPKSPLHTLLFLKLRISINRLLSLWMASSHTSHREKKTLRYKQSFKALAWAAIFPSFLCQWQEVLWRWSPWPLQCPLRGHCYHAWCALGLSLLISPYHQRPLSFQKQMKRRANFKGDASLILPIHTQLCCLSTFVCRADLSISLELKPAMYSHQATHLIHTHTHTYTLNSTRMAPMKVPLL